MHLDLSILNQKLKQGSDISGAISENQGMNLSLLNDYFIPKVPEVLEAPFIFYSAGEGPYAVYLEKYAQGKKYYASEIINEVKEIYNADISLIFNTAYLNYLGPTEYIEEALVDLSDSIDELFTNVINKTQSEQELIFNFLLIALLIELCREKVDLPIHSLSKISPHLETKSQIIEFIIKSKYIEAKPEAAKFFIKVLENSEQHQVKTNFIDFEWLKEINDVVNKAFSEFPNVAKSIVQKGLQEYYANSSLGSSAFTNSTLIDFVLTEFIDANQSINSIYDPCMGLGNTLIKVKNSFPAEQRPTIYANELNQQTYLYAMLNLIIEGIPINHINPYDSFQSSMYDGQHDLVCAIPPFGGKVRHGSGRKSSYHEAFLHHAAVSLAANGIAYIIIPTRYLSKGVSPAKIEIIHQNWIDGVIALPSIDDKTTLDLSLVILKKNRSRQDVFMANLSNFKFQIDKAEQGYIDFLVALNEVSENYKTQSSSHYLTDIISLDDMLSNRRNISPQFYIYEQKEKLEYFFAKKNIKTLKEVIESYQTGYPKSKSKERLNDEKPVLAKSITSKHLRNTSKELELNQILEDAELYPTESKRILRSDAVLISNREIEFTQLFKYRKDIAHTLGANIYAFVPNLNIILPEFLLKQLTSEMTQFQIERNHPSIWTRKYTINELLNLKIEIPSLEEQKKQIRQYSNVNLDSSLSLNEQKRAYTSSGKSPVTKALKHYISNRVGPTNHYLHLLKNYITSNTINQAKSLLDPVNDTNGLTVNETIGKIETFIKDVEEVATKFNELYKLDGSLTFEVKSLNKLLTDTSKKYTDGFSVNVIGSSILMQLNDFCISLIVENLLSNFVKHGISDEIKNPKVEFEISDDKSLNTVDILFKNNGHPFPKPFSFDDFITEDKRAGDNGGLGLGGNLIAKAVEKHNGQIEPITLHERSASGWNVILKITIIRTQND